jgi:hypothetical protein
MRGLSIRSSDSRLVGSSPTPGTIFYKQRNR